MAAFGDFLILKTTLEFNRTNRSRRSGILSSPLREPPLHLLSFWKPTSWPSNPGKLLHPPSHMFKSVTKSAFALTTKKTPRFRGRAFVASWLITTGKSCPAKPHKASGTASTQPFPAGEVQSHRHHRTWASPTPLQQQEDLWEGPLSVVTSRLRNFLQMETGHAAASLHLKIQ